MMGQAPLIALALALTAASPPDPGLAVGARLSESAAAAQALQGPLDGGWAVKDAKGRLILILEISDPPGGSGPVQGAWRPAEGPGTGGADVGAITSLARLGARLRLVIADAPGGPMRLDLRRSGPRTWRGRLIQAGRRRAVNVAAWQARSGSNSGADDRNHL